MWRALYSGIVYGKSGKLHRFRRDDYIDAPLDEFRGVPSLGWIAPAPDYDPERYMIYPEKYLQKMTVAEIKRHLDERGIRYKSGTKKAGLIQLLAHGQNVTG